MRQALVFYLVFTVVYGLMHFVVISQAARALDLTGFALFSALIWFTAMTLAPVGLGMAGERTGLASLVCYVWMGFIFYMFLFCLLFVVVRLIHWPQAHRVLFWFALAASVAVCGHGYANARRIQVREVDLTVANMPAGVDSLRIAAISDLHLYSVEEGARLDRILPILETLDYDLLVSLGDLIESGIHRAPWGEEAARLARLRPRLGKFAVAGNHELYADLMAGEPVSREFHEAAGFTLLDGEAVEAGGEIFVAGVDYPGHGRQTGGGPRADVLALTGLPRDRPVILLKHLPKVDPLAVGLFDLQLSGHSHDGQLWPFTYVVKYFFPYIQGLYDLGGGSKLYVTPGTGVWGPPMRVGSSPEITLVVLRRG
jgi:uncharacterized protein